jgi:hypothetical protein
VNTHQASFIRSVRQIRVPGFADAFNPSIVRYEGHLLLSFRTRRRRADGPVTADANTLGLVFLDSTRSFAVGALNAASVLEFSNPYGKQGASRAHDPRLVIDPATGALEAVYSNFYTMAAKERPAKDASKPAPKPRMVQTRRMFISRVTFTGAAEPALDVEHGAPLVVTRFEGSQQTREQKNWIPFEHAGERLFVQSMQPHRVVSLQHESLTELAAPTLHVTRKDLGWQWGELRGGSPAVLLPASLTPTAAGAAGPDYIAFFHSSQLLSTVHSNGTAVQHYFMGAYTFSAHPPFAPTRISREPVFAPGMYDPSAPGLEHPTYKPIRCVFPTGLLIEEDAAAGPTAHVTFGKQDFEAWVLTLSLTELLRDNLRPV